MSYYNTTGSSGEELAASKGAAAMQEQSILSFMRQNRMTPYTAEQIEQQFGLPRTSVSRAMRNLTARGAIRKSSSARWKSSYGRSCYAWRAE